MNDSEYVYVSAKLLLKPGQTRESIQEIVSEMDYSFSHEQIIEHEIREITRWRGTWEMDVGWFDQIDRSNKTS